MIQRRISAGEKVGFHGATHGLNTLFHVSGVRRAPVFIFDGDITKTGRYLPASASKIRGLDDPLYSEMDVIIVSALSFEEEITADAFARTGLSTENILPMLGEAIA